MKKDQLQCDIGLHLPLQSRNTRICLRQDGDDDGGSDRSPGNREDELKGGEESYMRWKMMEEEKISMGGGEGGEKED